MASYLHRTARPPTLAAFRPWGDSAGAGRIRLAGPKILRNDHQKKTNYPSSPVETVEFQQAHQFIGPGSQGPVIDQDHIIIFRLQVVAFGQLETPLSGSPRDLP